MAITHDNTWTQPPVGPGSRLMGREPGAISARRNGLILSVLLGMVMGGFLAHQLLTGAWMPHRPDFTTDERQPRVGGSDLDIPNALLIDTALPASVAQTPAPASVILQPTASKADEELERLARQRREQLMSALTASSSIDVSDADQPGQDAAASQAAAGQNGLVLPGSPLSADYLAYGRTPALSLYEIKAGSVMPAAMLTGINSDLAGEIVAQTTEPVYDSVRGQHVLIPSGSRLVGLYNHEINFGQERVQIVWHRVIFPDGSSLRLDGMNGTDALGQAGVTGDVNNHWGKIFGAAALTTLFSVGYELLTDRNRTASAEEDAISEAVGNNVFNTASQITQRNLNIAPTIEVSPGALINVLVNKDIVFTGPYTATR